MLLVAVDHAARVIVIEILMVYRCERTTGEVISVLSSASNDCYETMRSRCR